MMEEECNHAEMLKAKCPWDGSDTITGWDSDCVVEDDSYPTTTNFELQSLREVSLPPQARDVSYSTPKDRLR